MRCPKCGFISFDHLENCKKCNKQIDESSMQLNGTTYDTASPAFLKFEITELENVEDDQPFNQEEMMEDSGVIELADFEDTGTIDDEPAIELDEISLDMDDGNIEDEEDIILNLDDLDDASPLEDFNSANTLKESEEATGAPAIDFGDLDISDLAPTEDKGEDIESEQGLAELSDETPVEEDITLALDALDEPETIPAEKVETEPAVKQEPQAVEPAAEKTGSPGLEDLLIDELEFDQPVKEIASKSNIKPIKTGTALDNFDIDLGELFTEKEK